MKFKYFGSFIAILLAILFSSPTYALSLDDRGQVNRTSISQIINIESEKDIIVAIKKAKQQHLPIAIMAVQHSQGGQTLASHAIALNMLTFNKILNIDVKKKQVTVQSGITWAALQNYINHYNLAIKSMQSPNIFTVGGSISVNAHGDDFRNGAVGNSIISFNMILANGNQIVVSKTSHPELWEAVRGGYGLLGVITDVTLQLTENNWFVSHYQKIKMNDLPMYFKNKILANKDAIFFYAHVNISPGQDFLRNAYVITHIDKHQKPEKIITLDNPDKWNTFLTPAFNFSRHGELARKMRWNAEMQIFKLHYNQHRLTRNNAMQKPLRFASDYSSKKNIDWLQEYFIPLEKLPEFMDKLREVAKNNHINLLNVTIRYVPAEKDILLSYANKNCFSVVLYFNQNLAKNEVETSKQWTQELINAALYLNGSYYLTYQDFATKKQFEKAYPNYKKFMILKQKYDKNSLFSSKFYQTYFVPSIARGAVGGRQ